MISSALKDATLNRRLATFLQYGTWIASAVIALGILLLIGSRLGIISYASAKLATTVVKIGVGVFILLPIFRLVLMFVVFFRQRDFFYASIAALVLTIIGVGCALGVVLGPVAG